MPATASCSGACRGEGSEVASSQDPDGAELGTPDKAAESALFPGSEAMANSKGERTTWPIVPGVSA